MGTQTPCCNRSRGSSSSYLNRSDRPSSNKLTKRHHALPPEGFQDAILKPISSVEFARKFGIKGHFVKCQEQAIELSAQLEFPILLQEYIPGPPDAGYFIEGFFDRTGELRALLARRRLRMHPAILGNSSLTESVPLKEVGSAINPFLAMLGSVHYRGMFSAEFKFDERSGQFKLLEVNARAWWYVGFAAHCGVDLCQMSYRDALQLPFDSRMVEVLNANLKTSISNRLQKRISHCIPDFRHKLE